MRLSHQQEHWDRGPVEINSAEEGDTTGWNTRRFFSASCQAGGAEISNIFG
jgi:hypothetical protein